ncbi:MAG: B12-binding domain-containing radical SAM protein [Acidimicrobiales bacterium]
MQPILVASTYYLELDPKQVRKMRPFPPLATLYVAAGLRAAGHPVVFFDAMLARAEGGFEAALERWQPRVVVLYDDNFNFLSKMCLTRMRDAALRMCRSARAAGAWVVVSGPDMTDHPQQYLAAGAHAVAVGEGDHTVLELVEWRQSGGTGDIPGRIPGVVGGPTGTITGARRNERHPDVFPHPARDLVDMDAYRQLWRDHHGRFTLNIVSTRGCPFHCNWCAKPIWGQRYAMRSAADVAAEVADLKSRFQPDELWFADDIFGLREAWLEEFAAEIQRQDAVIPFSMQSRCDLMSAGAVAALHRAGCAEVWLGAESGSQRVLDAMDKGITVQDIRTARRRLGEAGIRASFFVQFGYPGEDLVDIRATIELLRETLPDNIGVSVSYPLPGTRFHTMVADQLADKVNWEDSADLDMMFRGTFSSAFYRHLHTVLHDDLHLHRRLAGLPGVPAVALEEVPVAAQQDRVDAGWARLEELALTERLRRPTLLVRSEPVPVAPDLSQTHG